MKATWRPEDARWLADNPHGLPPSSPYGLRGMGGYGHQPGSNPSTIPAPEKLLSTRDVAAWRVRHEATCSDRAARCLAWLEQAFGRGTTETP